MTEQAYLWQTRPNLAQALIEVEHLTAARIPDMNKVEVLFDMAADTELAAETLNQLQNQQQLCRLACENLRRLQYKIRSYQEFEPGLFVETEGKDDQCSSQTKNSPRSTNRYGKIWSQRYIKNVTQYTTTKIND